MTEEIDKERRERTRSNKVAGAKEGGLEVAENAN